jgi:hypothetical protein
MAMLRPPRSLTRALSERCLELPACAADPQRMLDKRSSGGQGSLCA